MALRVMRWLGIAGLVVGYPVLAHLTNQSAQFGHLGVWLALGPVILIALALAWRSSQRFLMLGLVSLFCLVLWLMWPLLQAHFGVIYWLQHAGIQLLLLIIFGRTLIGKGEPLCTRFARVAHAPITLSARHEQYTCQVTVAWTVFFALMAIISTMLFFLAPLATWSFFANFLTLPLVALMFVAEYKIRAWALPNVPPIHFLDAVRAFKNVPHRSH